MFSAILTSYVIYVIDNFYETQSMTIFRGEGVVSWCDEMIPGLENLQVIWLTVNFCIKRKHQQDKTSPLLALQAKNSGLTSCAESLDGGKQPNNQSKITKARFCFQIYMII